MKKLILFTLFLTGLLFALPPGSTAEPPKPPCNCGNTQGTNHKRQDIKDRKMPASVQADRSANVEEMIDEWQIPPTNPAARKTYQREDSVFEMTGWLRLTKLSSDDCDYHMEIAISPQDDNRTIAEIPNTQEYCALRQQFLQQLKEKCNIDAVTSSPVRFSKKKAPQITIIGYAFLDTAHRGKADPTDPQGNGSHGSAKVATLWEIHPILKLEIK